MFKSLNDTNSCHMCLCLSGRLDQFASDYSNQSGSCSSAKSSQSRWVNVSFISSNSASRCPTALILDLMPEGQGSDKPACGLFCYPSHVNPVWLKHTTLAHFQTCCSYMNLALNKGDGKILSAHNYKNTQSKCTSGRSNCWQMLLEQWCIFLKSHVKYMTIH